MARKFKYQVQIRSIPGLKPEFRSMLNVVAEDEKQARYMAIKKLVDANRVIRRRRDSKFWIIDSVYELADANNKE